MLILNCSVRLTKLTFSRVNTNLQIIYRDKAKISNVFNHWYTVYWMCWKMFQNALHVFSFFFKLKFKLKAMHIHSSFLNWWWGELENTSRHQINSCRASGEIFKFSKQKRFFAGSLFFFLEMKFIFYISQKKMKLWKNEITFMAGIFLVFARRRTQHS